jgi:hypothetical protein
MEKDLSLRKENLTKKWECTNTPVNHSRWVIPALPRKSSGKTVVTASSGHLRKPSLRDSIKALL